MYFDALETISLKFHNASFCRSLELIVAEWFNLAFIDTLPDENGFIVLVMIVHNLLSINLLLNRILYRLSDRMHPGRKDERHEVENNESHEDFDELCAEDFKSCRWLHTCQLKQEVKEE